ncbi:FAD-dependent oxidoreductase [Haloechinothrix sp. LS1_15]|uniref:NAD(P)/FAD-dependent oxidoreductase n=1 Tax=Haloechinothrix sp. LS1_15 TaxID=2652248 RepID=UPI002948A09A|nr:FAD-dependent oxidoreductase [Haloechinothrix sp. LS1_15]MDV6014092.1 FAD-dependent oxidoreductase [Haloechinothrix sp. LS1_15]
MPDRLVVVGASLAGLRAVEAARRAEFAGAITLIGAEPHAPYDRPPLSKEFLTERGEPTYLRDERSLRDELDVDLRLGTAAESLRPQDGTVVAGGEEISYTGLVIATGAAARPLAGAPDLAGVYTLRTLDDARAIRAALGPGVRIVVIGAGFIGSEIACSAGATGAEVTVVEAAPVPLAAAVGERMGTALAALHERNGTQLRCGVPVTGIEGERRVEAVALDDGTRIPADVVIVGVGATPETGWLAGSGVKVDDGVVCDETLGTGLPGVYAAGDVARWPNPLFGETMRLEHWTTAAEQGALAARNAIAPEAARPCSTVPYFWSDWYDSRIQFVGVPTADEVRVVAGDPDSDSFLALYRRGERVIGALGLNRRREVMKLRAMIGKHASWDDALGVS